MGRTAYHATAAVASNHVVALMGHVRELAQNAGLTLDDVGWFDLAYAPPVGPSWDPIHVAAQALKRSLF